MDYILFIIQDANFENLTLLASWNKYHSHVFFQVLKQHSTQLHINRHNINVLYSDYTQIGNISQPIHTEYSDTLQYIKNLIQYDKSPICDLLDNNIRYSHFYTDLTSVATYKSKYDPLMAYSELIGLNQFDGQEINIIDHIVVLDRTL